MIRYAVCALALLALASPAPAAGEEDLLPAEEAFRLKVATEGNVFVAEWQIAPGYYLYRDKFRFDSLEPDVRLKAPVLPAGVTQQDPYFGPTVIYRDRVRVRVPFESAARPARMRVRVTAQGCNEPLGVCYPPMTREVAVDVAPPKLAPSRLKDSERKAALGLLAPSTEPTDPRDAFRVEVAGLDSHRLSVRFTVGECCYLYRDKMAFVLTPSGGRPVSGTRIDPVRLPRGELVVDEFFGRSEVYRGGADIMLAVPNGMPRPLFLDVTYQGCAERPVAICYEPIARRFRVDEAQGGLSAEEVPRESFGAR